MSRAHPDLRSVRLPDGAIEVFLAGLHGPIARATPSRDGRWVTMVWSLQNRPPHVALTASERKAVRWLRGWCRAYAWRLRPNVALVPHGAFGGCFGKIRHPSAATADSVREPGGAF